MKWLRIQARGEASRLALIRLIHRVTPVTLDGAREVVDAGAPFRADEFAVVFGPLDDFTRKWGTRFEDVPDDEIEAVQTVQAAPLDPQLAPRVNVRYLDGPRKIAAIKLARELLEPRPGLKETKTLVEHGDLLACGLPIAEAKTMAARFVELESEVGLEPLPAHHYAVRVGDGARDGPLIERLRVLGPTLIHERGRLGDELWEPLGRQQFSELAPRERAVAEQQQAWRDAGLQVFDDALDALAAMSPRNPELEQEIRAAAEPESALMVHADWLLSVGDPRGELAAAQLADDLVRAEALIEAHRAHLLGPLSPELPARASFEWRAGLVQRLLVDLPRFSRWRDGVGLARALLELPCCACVRRMHLRGVLSDIELGELLIHPHLAGLRELRINCNWWSPPQISSWSGLPRLELLALDGISSDGVPLELPALRRLELASDGFLPAKRLLVGAHIPRLRELSLTFVGRHIPRDVSAGFTAALGAPSLTALRQLELHFGEELDPTPVITPYLEALTELRMAAQLEHVILTTPSDASLSLERARELLGDRIELRHTEASD